DAGDISGGAEKHVATILILANFLRAWSCCQSVDVFGLQGKDRRLRKYNKTVSGNGSKHGRLFDKTKKRGRGSANRRFHYFQGCAGGMRKVAITRKHGAQFGQNLGGKQRRPAGYEWIGQIVSGANSRAGQTNSLGRDRKDLSAPVVNRCRQ